MVFFIFLCFHHIHNKIFYSSLSSTISFWFQQQQEQQKVLDTFTNDLYLRHRLVDLERVRRQLQSNQQKLLHVLETEDVDALQELLSHNPGDGGQGGIKSEDGGVGNKLCGVQLNEKLSSIYPITALDYAASMVSFLNFFVFI